MPVAATDSFNGCAVDSAPANVRLVRMLLISFVVVAVQLPQSAQAAVIRIPTGSRSELLRRGVIINSVSVELRLSFGM